MDDFLNKFSKQLEANFNEEVMKHVTDQKILNDPASIDLMFHQYVDEEAKFNRCAYERKDLPDVAIVTPITISEPDLSYRDEPTPNYLSADQNMSAVDLGKEWLFGKGPNHRNFEPGSRISNEMANSIGAKEIEEYIIKNHGKNIPSQGTFVTNYDFDFGVIDAINEGLNPSSQFVGSWENATAKANGDNIDITVHNNTSLRSLLYGNKLGEALGFDVIADYYGVPTGNKSQSITWSVPRSKFFE